MGSQGKFETRVVKAALILALAKSTPSGLKLLPGPGKNGAEEASSLNHRLIGWATNLFIACLINNKAEIDRILAICETHLSYQLNTYFECVPGGRGCEQRSPTHKKQQYQWAALLAYVGERFGFENLRFLAVSWLRKSLTLDSLFLAPSPSPRNKLPAIIQPGFRASKSGGQFKGARDYAAEEWYRVGRMGMPVPSNILSDPLNNVDLASLWFYDKLSAQTKAEIRQDLGPSDLPRLLFPITLQSRGDDFVGSMDWPSIQSQGGGEIQIFAGWVDGKETYGFDADTVPKLDGAKVSVIGRETGSDISGIEPPTEDPKSSPDPSPDPKPELTDYARLTDSIRMLAVSFDSILAVLRDVASKINQRR